MTSGSAPQATTFASLHAELTDGCPERVVGRLAGALETGDGLVVVFLLG